MVFSRVSSSGDQLDNRDIQSSIVVDFADNHQLPISAALAMLVKAGGIEEAELLVTKLRLKGAWPPLIADLLTVI